MSIVGAGIVGAACAKELADAASTCGAVEQSGIGRWGDGGGYGYLASCRFGGALRV